LMLARVSCPMRPRMDCFCAMVRHFRSVGGL
jgi:hypothetical protein